MRETEADAYIIQCVQNGEREAFRVLVQRYSGLVFRIAYCMCRNQENAQDAVQEVFYRAYRSMDRVDAAQPFSAWLRRITVNYLLDQKKKKQLQMVPIVNENNEDIPMEDESENPRERQAKEDHLQLVLNAMELLPEKYRMILMLRHFENLSYEEIAETLSLPIGTVTAQIHRARNKLAKVLTPMRNELMVNGGYVRG